MADTLKSSINMLIRFWEHSSEPWGAKDTESRFIFGNAVLRKMLMLPAGFNLEGRLDCELPSHFCEYQDCFQAHDRTVEKARDRVTALEIHPWENRPYLSPWFFDKYPLIAEDGSVRGTFFHGRPVENIILTKLNKIKVPTSLVFTPPSKIFTEREWEIIFYILHTYSVKEIAIRLGLSQRTVGNYVQNMYSKIGVCNKRGLIEYCHDNNMNNYIPQSFFNRCESFPVE